MIIRSVATIMVSLGLTGVVAAEDNFMIGNSTITCPTGWIQVEKQEERIAFRAPDGRQQATVSIMHFAVDPSFEDFKKLCTHRIEAEKRGGGDLVQSDTPFVDSETYGMYFSGGEVKINRIFSGYLALYKRELLTIYLESMGVAPKDHLETFKFFVAGLKRK